MIAAAGQSLSKEKPVERTAAVLVNVCPPEPYVEASRPCPGSDGLEGPGEEPEAAPTAAAGPAAPTAPAGPAAGLAASVGAAAPAGGVAAAPEAEGAMVEGGGLAV